MPTHHDSPAPAALPTSLSVGTTGPHWRSLFDRNPAAMILLDPQGHIVDANPAVQTRFGHGPVDLRGQAISVLMPDWDRPGVLAELAQGSQPHDATLRHASGQRCDVMVSLLPAAASGIGSGSGYFLIARDVTVQRRLQRKLNVQAEILTRTNDAVVVLDDQGAVVCWSDGAARLYGVPAQDMAGRPFVQLFDGPDRARLQQGLAEACFSPSGAQTLEVGRAGAQGPEAVLQLTVSRMDGVDPGRELWVIHGQDQTLSLRLERAERRTTATTERQAGHRQRLARAAVRLGQGLERKAMLQHLAEVARVQVGAHQSAIWLLDGPDRHPAVRAVSMSVKYSAWRGAGSGLFGGHALACLAWRLMDDGAEAHLTALLAAQSTGQAAKPVAAPGSGQPPPGPTADVSGPPLGWLAAPLWSRDGQLQGLLQVRDRDEGEFDAQDLAELQPLAQAVSAALEATRAVGSASCGAEVTL